MMIFLFGHGAWHPRDGYISLPAATTLTFYTQNSKLLNIRDALNIADGSSTFDPDGKWRAYSTVPNMTLSSFEENVQNFKTRARNRGTEGVDYDIAHTNPGQSLTLAQLLATMPQLIGNDLHWIACRAHALKKTNFGRVQGMNARETPTDYFFYANPERKHLANDKTGQQTPKTAYR